MCPGISFERRSLCERHLFEKHSGFRYECSICGKIYNRLDNQQGKCVGGEINKDTNSRGTLRFMKNLISKMKISTIQQQRTSQGRREFQQNNRKRSHSDHKRKQNQENPDKQQKTSQLKNITSPMKESTKENKQKNATVIPSKPPQNKAATSKPSDSVPSTIPTTNSPQPSSDALSLFAKEFSEDELQEAFKEVATLDLPKDLFPPVVKVNSQSSSQCEAILGAIASDSDVSYSPTVIPSTAPVYNPTPLNLKDTKLQQLKEQKKMLGGESLRHLCPLC